MGYGTVKDTDRGWAKLKRSLARVGGGGIYGKAGVIGGKAGERAPGSAAAEEPLTNAELALIHEFGLGHNPERSFIRAAFDTNHAKYIENMRKLVAAIYDGRITIERAIGLLGQQVASDIRNYVREGQVTPPNTPATIARKGSSKPLIETAQMVNAITSAVERGKSGEE